MRYCTAIAFVFFLGLLGCGGDTARYERSIPWALGGKSVAADLHTHTRYSDGGLSVQELTRRAVINGCKVLAITDHSDSRLRSVSPAFFDELDAMRRELPDMALLGGLEWNMPPHGGRQHVNVLVSPQWERSVLPHFKARFEAAGVSAQEAFTWLAQTVKDPEQRVLFYNHPLRHPAIAEELVENELIASIQADRSMIGFEGAPGHQRNTKIGAYGGVRPTIERWDPVAARVGGVWDRLLARGIDIWGALANSDYHNDDWDYEPCGFSRTVLQVPEVTADGVLRAIRAGTYWAGHGNVLHQLTFTVIAPGRALPASPGEIIRYRKEGEIKARLAVQRTAPWAKAGLIAELIGNCVGGQPHSIATMNLGQQDNEVEWSLKGLSAGEDKQSCYLRARVRTDRENGDSLMAYSNPIRIRLD